MLQSIIEQKLLRITYKQYAPLILFLYGPFRELEVWSLKHTCTDNSRRVSNLLTVVEQEMYDITGPFFSCQIERTDPLNKGPRRVYSI